jgi:hypothetical protein
LFLTEFTAVDPHTVEQNGKLAGDGNNSASATFGAHQSHAGPIGSSTKRKLQL